MAYAAVAFYLGVEMLSHLEGDRSRAEALFERASELAGLLDVLTGAASIHDASAQSNETGEAP